MGADKEPPIGGEPADDKSEPESGGAEPDEQPAREDESTAYSSGGSIEFQDATTKPRPPTPAELRARDKYAKKQKELEEARLEAEEKRRHQRRVLMGAAAAVGVVGLVAGLGYWMFSAPNVTLHVGPRAPTRGYSPLERGALEQPRAQKGKRFDDRNANQSMGALALSSCQSLARKPQDHHNRKWRYR